MRTNETTNPKPKTYKFWVGHIKYSGHILQETPTHWTIQDIKEGTIDIPKTAVRQEIHP